jgi:hypothetical protein
VLCCTQGKQRHIGRYKDETLAAQAYDRAAYYLYGTRANLNFRLVDVLADPSDVPASIKLAKEQPFVGTRLQSQFNTTTNTSCGSSSSSTCSYSPHSSRQAQSTSMHNSPACGFIQGYVTAGNPMQQQQQQVLMCMPQQHQQMPACIPEQQQTMHPGWVQQLPGGAGVPQIYPSSGLIQPLTVTAGMMQQQVMQQGVIGVVPAGLPLSLQQQQQVPMSAAAMPEVVTTMIAGLCCDDTHAVSQSTALATSSCSTQATAWTPSVNSSMVSAHSAGLPAAHAASAVHFPGFLASSGCNTAGAASSSSSAGLLLAHSSQQEHLGWPSSSSTPYQGAATVQIGSSSNEGSMPGQLMSAQFAAAAAGHPGNMPVGVPVSTTAGQVMPLGYLAGNGQAGNPLQQQQQQTHMLQLQSHSIAAHGFTAPHGMQRSAQHGTAGGVYHPQQLSGDVPLQVTLPDGVFVNSSQLGVMPDVWPQQQQQHVLLS